MSSFQLYLQLGISHITDIQGYDHILFLLTLCAVYQIKQWKSVLVLITAFTVGHCTTLLLSTLNFINISSALIEFLIPLTILITAIVNIIHKGENITPKLQAIKYSTALFFGLIHGLGFSSYLKSLLGLESNIIKPLFAFNLGIELGQMIIVLIFFIITSVITDLLKLNKRNWTITLSGISVIVSLMLSIMRFPV
ncbi:MAG: HupE/UreJ family protein [Bacteroidales bacterium]|jgi:hypothetical protein|nr:HupE/UreJ family protein [Bacteroidales bacterium]